MQVNNNNLRIISQCSIGVATILSVFQRPQASEVVKTLVSKLEPRSRYRLRPRLKLWLKVPSSSSRSKLHEFKIERRLRHCPTIQPRKS